MEGKKRRLSSVAAKTSGAPRKRSKTGSDEEEGGLVIGHGHKRQTKVQRSDIIKPKGAAKTQNLEADHVEEDEVFLVETTPTTPHYDGDDAQSQNEFDSLKDSQNKSDQENDENGTQNEREKDQSVMRDEAVDDNGIVGTQSEGDGGAGLYVFQCASCSTIVGDSLAMHAIDEELNTTTLRGTLSYMRLCLSPTCPVYLQWRRVWHWSRTCNFQTLYQIKAGMYHTSPGFRIHNAPSTYYRIKCKNTKCGKTLGKYYYSTPKALVNLQ